MAHAFPIFANSSYLISLGAPPAVEKVLLELERKYHLKTRFCQGPNELTRMASAMSRIVGIFVFHDQKLGIGYSDLINAARAVRVPIRVVGYGARPTAASTEEFVTLLEDFLPDSVEEALEGFLKSLEPKGLESLVVHAANRVFPTFFPKIGSFTSVRFPNDAFDYQINYFLAAGDVLGRSVIHFRRQELERTLGTPASDFAKLIDAASEAHNQCNGLFNTALTHVGLEGRVGLPMKFDLKKIPAIETGCYFPMVNVAASSAALVLSLGFVNMAGGDLFDLSGYDPDGGSDDLEFL